MKPFISFFAALLLAGCVTPRDLAVDGIDCRTGLYVNEGSEAIALTPLSLGGYRWRMLDGRTGALGAEGGSSRLGWTEEADGLSFDLGACGDDRIEITQSDVTTAYTRASLEVTDVTFEHDGIEFAGRLIWPRGSAQAPLVVQTHGSERWSAVRSDPMQWLLAAQGIATFTYDKRGTGRSGGEYTQNFYILAQDARAALAQARSMAGGRVERVGFLGGSQGGWISPLAASEANVDFVVALYGLAVSPLQEDRSEVVQNLARAGWGEAEQSAGAELSAAAGEIMRSNFQSGYAEFNRLRRMYRDAPWYNDIDGEFTSEMLPYPELALRIVGPTRGVGTSWDYDPAPVLRALDVPQFWMIAADDTEAPPAETITRIRALQAEGRPIDLAIYPDADHGMIITERRQGDTRRTGFVPDYFRTIGDWILARDLTTALVADAEVTLATPAPATP